MTHFPPTEELPPALVQRVNAESQQLTDAGYANHIQVQANGMLVNCRLPRMHGSHYQVICLCATSYPLEPPRLTVIERAVDSSGQEETIPLALVISRLRNWQPSTTLLDLVHEIHYRVQQGDFERRSAASAAPTVSRQMSATDSSPSVSSASEDDVEFDDVPPLRPSCGLVFLLMGMIGALLVGLFLVWGSTDMFMFDVPFLSQPTPQTAARNDDPDVAVVEPTESLPTRAPVSTPTESPFDQAPADTPIDTPTDVLPETDTPLPNTPTPQATATDQVAPTSAPLPEGDPQATTRAQIAGLESEATERTALHLSSQLGDALSLYAPDLEALLIQDGYYANVFQGSTVRGLRSSQADTSNHIRVRDLDYALDGYSYVLGDMSVLRDNVELFLLHVDANGVVPDVMTASEQGIANENRQNWDSMPGLIHAAYSYIAKTGDQAFYLKHRDTLLRIGSWIMALDTDGDHVPDGNNFPPGYYEVVDSGVMHTYAIARFYAAYQELAALEQFAGFSGDSWIQEAEHLRNGFHRPFAPGGTGYWIDGQAWPIAWHRADGGSVNVLETFGVFYALHSGLISPADGERYTRLVDTLHTRLPDLLAGTAPLKLMSGGYASEMMRTTSPPEPMWKLDANAPWIVGLAAPVYASAGYPQDADTMLQAYMNLARSTNPPIPSLIAGPTARFGAGNTNDGGHAWSIAAWFMAVYGGHYGLTMTPDTLVVEPHPFVEIPVDSVSNFSYQGAVIQMRLDRVTRTYNLQVDRPTAARLLPMGDATALRVNNGALEAEVLLVLQPGQVYTVVSE